MITDIYLVRHGETDNNKLGILVGQRDVELSVKGREQIREMIRKHPYPQPSAVYVSPMRRCLETADLVFPHSLETHGARIEERLREMDFGSFEGMPVTAFSETELYEGWVAQRPDAGLPGGETFGQVEQRMIEAFDRILSDCRSGGIRTVGVVSHNMVITRLLCGHIIPGSLQNAGSGQDIHSCPNGMGFHLRADEARWRQKRLMELAGLLPEGAERPDPLQSPYIVNKKQEESK